MNEDTLPQSGGSYTRNPDTGEPQPAVFPAETTAQAAPAKKGSKTVSAESTAQE